MSLPLDGKVTHGCRFHVRGSYGLTIVTIAHRASRLAAEGALKAWKREREATDPSANCGWTFWIEEGEA